MAHPRQLGLDMRPGTELARDQRYEALYRMPEVVVLRGVSGSLVRHLR